MDIRVFDRQDGAEFVRLRLEALTRELHPFARMADDALPWPDDSVPAQLRPVAVLLSQGKTVRDIATEWACPEKAVHRHLRQL